MTAAATPFSELMANAHRDIKTSFPMIAHDDHSITDLWATIMALSDCRFEIICQDNDVAGRLVCEPAATEFPMAIQLIDHYSEVISSPLQAANARLTLFLDRWVNSNGFLIIITRLIERGASHQSINDMAQRLAVAINDLEEQLRTLAIRHFNAVTLRDLGFQFRYGSGGLNSVAYWALAPDLVGNPIRPTVIGRRRQAIELYGGISLALLDPEITTIIDEGLPLSSRLAEHLSLSGPQLRKLLNARTGAGVIEAGTDLRSVVDLLILHEVPLHEWPEGEEWNLDSWRSAPAGSLFRPDYIGDKAENRDAMAALREDLLVPIAVSRAQAANLFDLRSVCNFAQSVTVPLSLSRDAYGRDFLRALRNAVIGPRKVKSFHEAVERWHRRAATLAAVRHERRTERPGWPALCPDWMAADGRHSIVPLTRADQLVVEGNALNHCVGGYYALCRSGGTQILSVREEGRRVATLELLVTGPATSGFNITVGQFKAHFNGKPSPQLHSVVRDFLEALRGGRHPIAYADLTAYRKEMQRSGDHIWSRDALTLDHARQVWPLYQSLLPKPVPATFDQWVALTGLEAAFDQMIRHIAKCTTDPNGQLFVQAIG